MKKPNPADLIDAIAQQPEVGSYEPDRTFTQRDLDLAVLKARQREVKAIRYVACRSETPGDVILECDKLLADLEKKREALSKV